MSGQIVFPSRSFREVHQLVFLFQSWQLILREAELPPALQPLNDIPDDLVPVISRALRSARDQLEAAQAGSEIALRFEATPGFAALTEWAALKLREVEDLIAGSDLDPAWVNAVALAGDLVSSAVSLIAAPEAQI